MPVAPARRLLAAVVAALTLLVGAPFLSGVAQATHTVGSVSPRASQNNTTVTVSISGTGFVPAAETVKLKRVADPGIPGNEVTGQVQPVSTPNELVVTFNLALANPGTYDVIVSRTGEDPEPSDKCAGCFSITRNQAPALTDSQRDTRDGADLGDLILRGLGFTKGDTIQFLIPGTQTVDAGLKFVRDASGTQNSTTIYGHYSIVGPFTPGLHDLALVDGNTAEILHVCSNCFKQPDIDEVTPATAGQGATNRDIAIKGGGLVGSIITFSPSTSITTVNQSTTSEALTTVRITVASNAATGPRAVNAIHPDGGVFIASNALTITARPVVDSLSETRLGQGASNVLVTATGSGFQPGMTLQIPGLVITDVLVSQDGKSASFRVSVPTGTAIGPRDLTVVNPDEGRNTKLAAIAVTAGPTVTRVIPSSLPAGASNQPITIKGTGFALAAAGGVTVTFGEPGGITVHSATTTPDSNGETIVAIVSVSPLATGGLRTVTVTNNDDHGRGTCAAPGCFGVDTITAVTPPAANNTESSRTITLTKTPGGAPFSSASQVQLIRNGAQPGEPAIPGSYISSTADTLTFSVNLLLAGPGAYNIEVVTGPSTESCSECFTVTGGDPVVSSVRPTTAARGATSLLFEMFGQNFSRGGEIVFYTDPAGTTRSQDIRVVPGSYDVRSSTHVVARLEVDSDATGTVYAFYDDDSTHTGSPTNTQPETCDPVTNCDVTFVDPPSFRSTNPISPNKRGQNSPAATITVVGDEFDNSTTLNFGPGVNVLGYVRTIDETPGGDDTIKVTVSVNPDAELGPRTVTATTSSGQATCSGCFEVTPAPSITSVSPAAAKRGQSVNVTINGTGFRSGLTNASIDAGPDIEVTNVAFVSDSKITATFTIGAGAALGQRDVLVQNTDGGIGRGDNVFRVITAPGAPGRPTAVAGDRQVMLSWSAAHPGGGTITQYRITCSPACPAQSTPGVTNATVTGLQNGTVYTFQVTAVNEAGAGPASAASNAVVPLGPDGEFVPVTPFRVFDTRSNDLPGPAQRMGPRTTRTVKIAGAGNGAIPTTGVSGVVLNVTAVKPTTTGNVKVYPADGSVPETATVAYRNGEIVANLTKVKLGTTGANLGAVKVYNSAGSVDVILDVVGYFSDGRDGSPQGDRLVEAGPKRVVDTRDGVGTTRGPLTAQSRRVIDLETAASTVPDAATAVVVNVTVTRATTSGYVTLYPSDAASPRVSNLNFRAGQTVANLAVVKLGPDGKIRAFSGMPSGSVHLVLDLVGYYAPDAAGTMFKGISPVRVVNTTASPALGGTRLGPKATGTFTIAGRSGVPTVGAGVRSVVASVQAVSPTAHGYLSVWPADEANPGTSVVNFPANRTTLNLVVAEVDNLGRIKIFNGSGGTTNIVIDVVGYYISQP